MEKEFFAATPVTVLVSAVVVEGKPPWEVYHVQVVVRLLDASNHEVARVRLEK